MLWLRTSCLQKLFFWADQKQRKAKLWNMAHKEPEPPLTKTCEQMLTHRLGPVMVKW
jgi:hypothetical protein